MPEPYEAGQKLVVIAENTMFRGEVGVVSSETNPYPESGVYLKLPGWPTMWWDHASVRPFTKEDEARYVPFSGPMGVGVVPDPGHPSIGPDAGAHGGSGA